MRRLCPDSTLAQPLALGKAFPTPTLGEPRGPVCTCVHGPYLAVSPGSQEDTHFLDNNRFSWHPSSWAGLELLKALSGSSWSGIKPRLRALCAPEWSLA